MKMPRKPAPKGQRHAGGRRAPHPAAAGAQASVERVPIETLTSLARNPRQHGARDLGYLEDVIQRVGASRSGVIDEAGVILAGNGMREASMNAGLREALIVDADGTTPVFVRRRGLTDAQKAELVVADNQAAQLSTWDVAMLQAYAAENPDIRKGWTDEEWATLFGDREPGEHEDGLTDPDVVPAQRPTSIKTGDLFALGDHRLLCGDSTRIEEVERALQGRRPELVFTDPPYGVNVSGKGGDSIAGDISFTAIPLMFDVLDKVISPKGWCYVCGGQSNMALYSRLFERYFRQLPRVIVWDKGAAAVMRHNGYHSCYEFIYFAFKEGGGNRWFGGRDSEAADDIIRHRVERGVERVHVTQKPVALPLRAITNTCPPDGLVFEPFGGSGSTLIAAIQAKRPSVTIEMDEGYCQVIIDRWEAFTGQKAETL